jgi:membrane fusion protein (multidrug efflux system)
MKTKKWVSAASLIILAGVGAGAYHHFRAPASATPVTGAPSAPGAGGAAGAPSGGPPPVAVEVITLVPRALDEGAVAVGNLKAAESVMVRTEVAGKVLKVGFSDGQSVGQGAVLLQIDASVAQAELAQASAELDLATENLRRVEDLKSKNFVSASALDQAAAARSVALAKVQLNQAKLQRYTLKAPFAGVVGLRNIANGDYVKEGADVIGLDDLSSLRLDFRLPEKLYPHLAVGMAVRCSFEAFPGQFFDAKLIALDPQVDTAGRSLLARARLSNVGQKLKPGMLAKVTVQLSQRTQAMVVPEEAIVPQAGEAYIYKVIEGKAVKTLVTLGTRLPGLVEITSGATEGDQIVVSGQIRIFRDQSPVRIVSNPS